MYISPTPFSESCDSFYGQFRTQQYTLTLHLSHYLHSFYGQFRTHVNFFLIYTISYKYMRFSRALRDKKNIRESMSHCILTLPLPQSS